VVDAKVKTLLPLPGAVIDAGEKVPVMPAGSPVTLRVTAELNAAFPAAVTVMVWRVPAGMVSRVADEASVNAGASTVTETAAELVTDPLVATTLKV